MGKLYYKYGTVSSAKTMNLLATFYNYSNSGKKVYLIKPEIDTRFGKDTIKSRAGSERKADLVLSENDSLFNHSQEWASADIILIDEVQFLTPEQVDQLWSISTNFNIDIIGFGLRADFMQQLFPATKRLFEVSDNIQEIVSTCNKCNRVASHNLRIDSNGEAVFSGPSVEISLNKFVGVCSKCYMKEKKKSETKENKNV